MASGRVLLWQALPASVVGALVACGGNVIVDPGGSGAGGAGAGTTSSSSSSSSSTTGTPTSSSSSSSSSSSTSSGQVCGSMTAPHGACSPGAGCPSSSSPCLAAVPQNGASVFGLRMAQVAFSAPTAFTTGIVQNAFTGAIAPNEPACNLNGTGTFNWLLQYDTVKGIVTVGGAAPAPAWGGPYSFVNTTVPTLGGGNLQVSPGILKAPFTGCAVDALSAGGEIVLPFYLNASGTSAFYLPLHDLQLFKGAVSGDHSCIGTYNAAGLDPANSCNPDPAHAQFIDGGYLSAYLVLTEADTVAVQAVNETLCVLLSNNSAMYGVTSSTGLLSCKKGSNGQILFQGDWCSTTNGPATSVCADSVRLLAGFAASGVTIQ